jgi:hypothetical protein
MLEPKIFSLSEESLVDTHVASSAGMIAEAAALAQPARAAVLGCGRGAEIPVRLLKESCRHVDFVELDADALSVVEAQCRSDEQGKADCFFHPADLTGLGEQAASRAREIVAGATDPSECVGQLGELLAASVADFWRPVDGQGYDLVVCSTVLTQLEASVREGVEKVFLDRFPGHSSAMMLHGGWKKTLWDFARRLEDGFVGHLRSLLNPRGVLYFSETVHCCWFGELGPSEFVAEGAWLMTRTSRLADYLTPSDEIVSERKWNWVWRRTEGPYCGRLYGVQALICRMG